MKHILKCIQPYFNYTWGEYKLFEVRKHDRDYQIGDYVILREYDPATRLYSPRAIVTEITFLLNTPEYCKEGFVIFGIKLINKMEQYNEGFKYV